MSAMIGDLGTLIVQPTARLEGDIAEVLLRVNIPHNMHIEAHEPADPWLIATTVEVDELREVEAVYPEPHLKDIGLPGGSLLVYDGTIEFILRGRVAGRTRWLSGRLHYQPCIGGACLAPRSQHWTVELGRRARAEGRDA